MKVSTCCKTEYKTQMVAPYSRGLHRMYPWHNCVKCGQKCELMSQPKPTHYIRKDEKFELKKWYDAIKEHA